MQSGDDLVSYIPGCRGAARVERVGLTRKSVLILGYVKYAVYSMPSGSGEDDASIES